MSEHQHHEDCSMSVFTIILNQSDAHKMDEVLIILESSGVQIDNVDRENGLVEGTARTDLVREIERAHLYEYIRTSFCYWYHEQAKEELEEMDTD